LIRILVLAVVRALTAREEEKHVLDAGKRPCLPYFPPFLIAENCYTNTLIEEQV
jgi:hypothetical protein